MRTLIIVGIIAFIVAVILVPGIWTRIKSEAGDMSESLESGVSDRAAAREYGEKLSEAGQGLREQYRHIYSIKAEMVEVEGKLNGHKDELEKTKQILAKAARLLKQHQPGDHINIGGREYSWEQLNQDALARLDRCKVLENNIENEAQILNRLAKAYADGQAMIIKAQDELRKKKLEFEIEKAELAALRADERVQGLIDGLITSSGSLDTDLSKARSIWKKKLDAARSDAEFRAKTGIGTSAGIVTTWGLEMQFPGEKATNAIDAYLGTDGDPEDIRSVPEVTVPETEPAVVE